jgi:DNA polymerase-3 subunit delta'
VPQNQLNSLFIKVFLYFWMLILLLSTVLILLPLLDERETQEVTKNDALRLLNQQQRLHQFIRDYPEADRYQLLASKAKKGFNDIYLTDLSGRLMNDKAANKILKILEEPPKNTLFLLVSEDTDQLLPTIISRTQIVKLAPLTDQEVANGLITQFKTPTDQANGIAHLASGSYQRAIKLTKENKIGEFNRNEFASWMRLCFTKDVNSLMKWSANMAKQKRENLKLFFEYALHMFRESLILNYSDPGLLRLEGSEKEFAIKFAPFINQANCIRMVSEFEEAILHTERNANSKNLLFICFHPFPTKHA